MLKQISLILFSLIVLTTITEVNADDSDDKYLSSNAENMYGEIINESDYTPEMRASLEASKAECRQRAAEMDAKGNSYTAEALANCDSMNLRTSDVTPPPNLGAQEVIVEKSGNRTTVITSAEQAQKAPGFEMFFSVAGLIATAFIVLKKD